jgi:peptide chain release factor 1
MAGIDDRLRALEERFDEIGVQLAEPDAYSDLDRIQRLSQEQARLREVVETGRAWRSARQAVAEAQELQRNESDPEIVAMAAEEEVSQRDIEERAQTHLRALLVPTDPNDERDVVVEIRAGTGGDEAAIFAADLFRMYSRYAERQRWQVEVLEASESGTHGFKEVIFEVHGRAAYSKLKFESGVHRVQRVPETESQGRIHTSAASVVVLPEADELEVNIADNELKIDVYRSTGPGGQSVNTTDSAVRITHLPTGIVSGCQNERSQHKNKERAMSMLRSKLYEHELEKKREVSRKIEDSKLDIDFGSQIRSYVLQPYRLIKDHRTKMEVGDVDKVIDGDLQPFIGAYLRMRRGEKQRN